MGDLGDLGHLGHLGYLGHLGHLGLRRRTRRWELASATPRVPAWPGNLDEGGWHGHHCNSCQVGVAGANHTKSVIVGCGGEGHIR